MTETQAHINHLESTHFKALNTIFNNKGIFGPIAEKALHNFKLKRTDQVNKQQRVHYFAVGHAFKQIDTKTLFKYELNFDIQEEAPTAYLDLQTDNFRFEKELYKTLGNIRNLNSHYAHRFDKLALDVIDESVIGFLKQAFKLSIIQAYQLEKKELPARERQLVSFLIPMFYPENKEKNVRDINRLADIKSWNSYVKALKSKSLDELLTLLLFIDVKESFKWSIDNTLEIFEIKKGRYLSFEANLFLVCMFLYKNEANKLISKIRNYKQNDLKDVKSKRQIFTFFAKKFTSQDVDAEEKKLVVFRDLIHYLNHYPTEWNADLKIPENNKNPKMTKELENQVIISEINRSYPDFIGDANFMEFAKTYFSSKTAQLNKLGIKYMKGNFSDSEKLYYETLTQSPLIKITKNEIESAVTAIAYNPKADAFKIYVVQYVLETYFPDKKGYNQFIKHRFSNKNIIEEYREKLFINENAIKLQKRIIENSLVSSYGRNKDRFMDFVTRFLAENKYFGEQTRFKCYQFYTMIEQKAYLEEFRKTHSKKEVDKLKYHQGKLVHFCTYQEHLARYPNWDMPFVVQNNAISLDIVLNGKITSVIEGKKIKKEVSIKRLIPIQRRLMPYFLENALFSRNTKVDHKNMNIENWGKKCLEDYFFNSYFVDFEKYKTTLETSATIEEKDKKDYKKLFPKRLLHHYCKPIKVEKPQLSALEKLLVEVENKEKEYDLLVSQTKKIATKSKDILKNDSLLLEHFLKRNKGKQFKLHFIRKACHLMYFKATYKMQVLENGHHKRFHITRDELNLFSKWMYAFEGEDNYKHYLHELFENKGFYLDANFKKLFSDSRSLDAMFNKVKIEFKKWLETPKNKKGDNDAYTLAKYPALINQLKDIEKVKEGHEIRYINVSHFIKFLKRGGKYITVKTDGKLEYQSLKNIPFLVAPYYYKDTLSEEDRKDSNCRKLYRKLLSVRLEDALLYEIAYRYRFIAFNNDIEKKPISTILNQNLDFKIETTTTNQDYHLSIPFNKVDSYAELMVQQRNELRYGSFLGDLQTYLNLTRINKGKDAHGKAVYYNGNITYADLNNIKSTVLNEALKFSKVILTLEKFAVVKDNKPLEEGQMYLKNEEIIALQQYRAIWKTEKSDFRNIAAHISLPLEASFSQIIKNLHDTYVVSDLETSLRHPSGNQLCLLFIQMLYNGFYNSREAKKLRGNPKKRQELILNTYRKEVALPIKNNNKNG